MTDKLVKKEKPLGYIFLGKTRSLENGYKLSSFEQAHFKAFIKGKTHFRHGFQDNPLTGEREAIIHTVLRKKRE